MSRKSKPQDILPEHFEGTVDGHRPSRSPIVPAIVYEMSSPDEANRKLGAPGSGYVYQREGHPNATWLGDRIARLHGADVAFITSSGMSALSLALMTLLRPGDHVLLSSRLYGKTLAMVSSLNDWGVQSSVVDMTDLDRTRNAMTGATRLLIAETISNPQVRVANLAALSEMAHAGGAKFLVDNTFASPLICRPMEHGADFVWESLSKIMNGHSDVILGALCASRDHASALESKFATWGVNAGPFECWLCERGLGTLHVRLTTACENALRIARWLATHARIKSVSYPGLTSHPEHGLCRSQFVDGCGRFGFMLMFEVDGGWEGATRLIERASSIPFCPSLGELTTTFSHPASTSHRRMSPNDLAMAGISAGSIRLSVGIDDPATVIEGIEKGLD